MLTPATPATLLVIPCYRHGDALAAYLGELCPALDALAAHVRIVVVEDGSPAASQTALAARINTLRATHPRLDPLIALPVNRGKGHAIRAGWATLRAETWLAFVDADGAVPASAVATLIRTAHATTAPTVFAAVRAPHAGPTVQRSWHRRLGSRLFNRWVRWHLALPLADTQCGLKIIPRSLHVLAPWHEDGFALDLEILRRAQQTGTVIRPHPIPWQEQSGSTLGWQNTLRLFAAARRLRARNHPKPDAAS